MRFIRALPIAVSLLASAASVSAAQTLPGATLDEAGHADVIGQFVCGMPGSTIDAFRAKVNLLVPGGAVSATYAAGQQNARDLIQKLRNNNDDLRELGASNCVEVEALMNNVMAATPQ
nr:hypothetical protein [Luteibacter rhizovicinus]